MTWKSSHIEFKISKPGLEANYSDRLAANYSSSGSQHEAAGSACLTDMEMKFMEEEEEEDAQAVYTCNCFNPAAQICSQISTEGMESINVEDCKPSFADHEQQYEILEVITSRSAGPLESMLMGQTLEALEMANENALCVCHNEDFKCRKNCFRRTVMNHLRCAGYNAAICKSRWKFAEKFPAGDYEYIDVIFIKGKTEKNFRLLVDINFRAQFEVARPTNQYRALVQLLPNIFVGNIHRLQKIIKIMCDALKESVKANGMHLPPWRKYKYMHSKWLGPYKRTANPFPCFYHKSSIEQFVGKTLMGFEGDYPTSKTQRDKEQSEAVHITPLLQYESGKHVNVKSNSDEKIALTTPKPIIERHRMVSGLASALAEAGLTSITTSHVIHQEHETHSFAIIVA
eukprot:Gb_28131 [translate_table: standard]